MRIVHYHPCHGCKQADGVADVNQLDAESPLIPAYATPTPSPATGAFECARYLDASGHVPANYLDGEWFVHPDWREAKLWSKEDGQLVEITEPNVTPEQIRATVVPYPGPGHVWRDNEWQEDHALKYQLAEQAAERELVSRQVKATAEINRITPAVDGGYAKQADVDLLPLLQRYLYELPDVREQAGWPFSTSWPEMPQ